MIGFKGRADRHRVVELLSQLVAINSVNPAVVGGGPGEAELANYLAGHFRRLGFETSLQEVMPGRPNLLAQLKSPHPGRKLLFESHLDTVTAANMSGGLTPRLEGNRLYGRGACDVKGSIAAFLHALELLAPYRDQLPADLYFLGAMDEEIGYTGSRVFVERGGRADAAVVFEPTGLQPVIAHKGGVRLRLATHGRSAHTSRPDLGENAIYHMAELIRALRARVEARLPERQHPLCGAATLSVSRISGGVQINVVPQECTIDVDWRTLPDEEPSRVLERVRAFVDELNREQPQLRAEVVGVIKEYRGLDTPADAPIVQTALEACRAIVGHAEPAGAPYGTDASELAAGGIPCVVLGPGDIAQAHTSDEWVEMEEVATAAEVFAELAMGLLGRPAAPTTPSTRPR
ncbi:MAG: M20 family metallopeptidase [Chloroflexota bacterium]